MIQVNFNFATLFYYQKVSYCYMLSETTSCTKLWLAQFYEISIDQVVVF